jgi:hypothetical protein
MRPGEPVNKFSAPVKEEVARLLEGVRENPTTSEVVFRSGKTRQLHRRS